MGILTRGGDFSWNPTCLKKCQPDSAWAVEAMAYSGGKCQYLRQKKKMLSKERDKRTDDLLDLQRYCFLC